MISIWHKAKTTTLSQIYVLRPVLRSWCWAEQEEILSVVHPALLASSRTPAVCRGTTAPIITVPRQQRSSMSSTQGETSTANNNVDHASKSTEHTLPFRPRRRLRNASFLPPATPSPWNAQGWVMTTWRTSCSCTLARGTADLLPVSRSACGYFCTSKYGVYHSEIALRLSTRPSTNGPRVVIGTNQLCSSDIHVVSVVGVLVVLVDSLRSDF